jgi:methionyl-tRNA formyltransferase
VVKNNKNIVLFVNDSYFSYLLSKTLIKKYHSEIDLIVLSNNIKHSYKKIFNIYKKVPFSYFIYRVFIQIVSKFVFSQKSVVFLAKKYGIKTQYIVKMEEFELRKDACVDTAFCFNFDIIINYKVLSMFDNGIYNIHASKLPMDKGISPILWAFSRGDSNVWSTIYKIDEGVDSGEVLMQFNIKVKKNDSSFSLYKRICFESGWRLSGLLDKIKSKRVKLVPQDKLITSSYNPWPDEKYLEMMRSNKKKHIKFRDIYDIFFKGI